MVGARPRLETNPNPNPTPNPTPTPNQASIEMRLRHYRARQQILSHRILKLVTTLESQQHMRTHHGAEPPPSHAERTWAREVP